MTDDTENQDPPEPPDNGEPDALSRFRSLERRGLDALDAGNFDTAAKLLLEAVAGYESVRDALRTNSAGYYLGVAFAAQGKTKQAARVWEEIIDRGWDSPAAFSRLVRYYESQDRPDEVRRLFKRLQRAAAERTGEFFAVPDEEGQQPNEDDAADEAVLDHPRRVLVADDEPSVCELVERALEPEGYTVVKARNGHHALRIILSTRLDLILLDYLMPGYTGLDVLYRLRAEGIQTPVLVISGRHEPQMVEDATRLDATWVEKPFTPQALADMARNAIRASAREHPDR